MGLDELEKRSAEGLWVEKCDFMSAGAGAGDLVDQGNAARLQALQHAVDVLHPQRQVVERVAALFQKLLQPGVATGSHQLEGGSVGEIEEGGVHFLRRHELLV